MSYCPYCETLAINGHMTHESGCELSHVDFSWFDFHHMNDRLVVQCGELELDTVHYPLGYPLWSDETYLRDNVEDWLDTIADRVVDELTKIADWSESYNCEHTDAGDNYLFMVSEGYWPDQWARIREYIADEFDVTDDILAAIESDLDSRELCQLVESRSGHIFSSDRPGDGIAVDSWPVGEIEEQIEISHLVCETGLPADLICHVVNNQRDHCVQFIGKDRDCCYLYICTDSVWLAVLTDDTIEDLIESAIERIGGDE